MIYRGTPQSVVEQIEHDIIKQLSAAEILAALVDSAKGVKPNLPAEVAELVRRKAESS